MKIIYLNSWWARSGKAYWNFIKKESKEADIFCLQEVTSEMFTKLQKNLLNFYGIYNIKRKEYEIGQAIFVRNDFKILNHSACDIYEVDAKNIGFLQKAEISIDGKVLKVGNIHGMAHPGDKLDNPKRLTQSEKIVSNFKKDDLVIFGGDFNLMPETKSVSIIESGGFVNLIKKYNIESTRSKVNLEIYPKSTFQAFADYVFISKSIKDVGFSVPDIVISDHLPLILDFEI